MASIYDVAQQERDSLATLDSATATRLSQAYSTIYASAQGDLDAFSRMLSDWYKSHPGGDPGSSSPSRHWLFQQQRYKALVAQLQQAIATYNAVAADAIATHQELAMRQAQASNDYILSSTIHDSRLAGAVSFAALPEDAINSVVGFASNGSPLGSLLAQRSSDMGRAARDTLLKGVGLGWGAREMATALDSALHQEHWKNLMLARTEGMRAYREAQRLDILNNADILAGWRWSSAADGRTCPICFSQHGKVFDINMVPRKDMPAGLAQHKNLTDAFGEVGRAGATIDPAAIAQVVKPTLRPEGLRKAEADRLAQGWETLTLTYEDGEVFTEFDGEQYGVQLTDGQFDGVKFEASDTSIIATHNHPRGFEYLPATTHMRLRDLKGDIDALAAELRALAASPPDDPRWEGNSFSGDDIRLAMEAGLAEMRATTPRWLYSMRPPPGEQRLPAWSPYMESRYMVANATVRSEFYAKIAAGTMTIEQAEAQHHHTVMQRFAEETGLVYSRENVWEALGG